MGKRTLARRSSALGRTLRSVLSVLRVLPHAWVGSVVWAARLTTLAAFAVLFYGPELLGLV
jgi:hypothetical protein